MSERISSGVDGLDAVTGGGFPRGSLILLAGNPGTGKTVFSMQFLVKGAEADEPGVYVSVAEEKELLIKNVSRHLGCDVKSFVEGDKIRILDFVAVRDRGVSAYLDMMLGEVEGVGAERLVIDSFTALAQALKEPIEVRIIVQTILSRLVRRMGCTTIMVEEIPIGENRLSFGLEEFVADGVIKVGAKELDERLLRDLTIIKIRSTEITERKLVFTLRGGFKTIPPFTVKPVEQPRRFKPIPDPQGMFSTGSSDLDIMLGGGVPRGSSIMLEIDEKTPTIAYHTVVAPMAVNFAAQCRGVYLLPSSGVNYDMLRKLGFSYGLSEEEFQEYVSISSFQRIGRDMPNILRLEGASLNDDLRAIMDRLEELTHRMGAGILCIVGSDTLVNWYGEVGCERFMNVLSSYVREYSSTLIYLVKAGRRLLARRLSSIADIHLKMVREHGVQILYGVKPRTLLWGVEMDTSKGFPSPKLTPLV
ncbi:MAG: ATPase domain-containing protein [Candidatus Bathyarchaeia archaeon]